MTTQPRAGARLHAPRPSRRILLISLHGYVAAEPELGRPDTGGQVVYVLKLAECLGRMGFKVDILTRRFEGQPATDSLGDHVRIVRIPAGGDGFIAKERMDEVVPEWVDGALRFIAARRLGYRFVSSHYWDAGLAGLHIAHHLGIPHVHTPHSLGAWKRDSMSGDPEELERRYRLTHRITTERSVYHDADLVIATTPQQRQLLEGADYVVPADRLVMVPPGYDDTRFFPVAPATRSLIKEDLGLTGPIVLALGRMARNKGYDLLLQAMPTVVERVPEARLLLAAGSTEPSEGEQGQIDGLHALAGELEVADRVLFHDHIPDEALADHYRAADVFALSSRYEPFGMTAVESMACGTPTVVTTEGGLWEMLRWGVDALYADPFDPVAYGMALANVLRYPRLSAELSRTGSEVARARFTWNGVTQQLLAALDHRAVHAVEGSTLPDGVRVATPSIQPQGGGLAWQSPAS
ncbi:MAG: glycosyltransferase [Chloroflexi bacterium]|nr:glycosyltransferase [Chloroflexota bacterium]